MLTFCALATLLIVSISLITLRIRANSKVARWVTVIGLAILTLLLIPIFMLLVFPSLFWSPSSNDQNITLEEAAKRFPIYLPPSEHALHIRQSDTLSVQLKRLDEICQYIEIPLIYDDTSQDTVVTIRVGSGCTYFHSFPVKDETELAWAKDGKAYILDEEQDGSWLTFLVLDDFQYEITSDESITKTLELLSSFVHLEQSSKE